jgi:glycosyltransferase involved in cell wall biosynthesis
MSNIKIAVLCLPGLHSFLNDIVKRLNSKYELNVCFSSNPKELEAAVNWADIVWLEWANEMTLALTNHPTLLNEKYVICRLHSYEAFVDDYCNKIDWTKINTLIFVAEHIKKIVEVKVKNLQQSVDRIVIIPNGINLGKLSYIERHSGHNLAYLGYINYKKGPMLLMHAFSALVQVDSRYKLYLAGKIQDTRYEYYFRQMINELNLEQNIQFDGWVENINRWLQDKHYIISSSVLESQGLGVMEAMACGIKPAIHNFVGARGIYPSEYLWNTIPEFIKQIRGDDYKSAEYRQFIQKNYSLEKHFEIIDEIISDAKVAINSPVIIENRVDSGNASQNFEKRTNPKNLCPKPQNIHPQIRKTLEKCIRPGMNVLDVGCKSGAITAYIAELGASVLGVDTSEKWIERALAESSHPNATYQAVDYNQMSFQQEFDVITIIQELEYIPRHLLKKFLEVIKRNTTDQTIIYVDVRDGRYVKHQKTKHSTHIISKCHAYSPDVLLPAFSDLGLQPYHVQIYGDEVPAQFNEYLFANETLFDKTYRGNQ